MSILAITTINIVQLGYKSSQVVHSESPTGMLHVGTDKIEVNVSNLEQKTVLHIKNPPPNPDLVESNTVVEDSNGKDETSPLTSSMHIKNSPPNPDLVESNTMVEDSNGKDETSPLTSSLPSQLDEKKIDEKKIDEKKMYHNMTRSDIDWHFECDFDDRPIIPQSAWRRAREIYASQLSPSSPFVPGDSKNDGFSVPIETRKAPGKGRGIFALRDIKRGELVWNTQQTARFATAEAFRDFIFALDEKFVCDALNFSYVQMVARNGSGGGGESVKEKVVHVDLDEGALCNSPQREFEDENIGCLDDMGKEYDGGCQANYFALRDIKEGEELLCAYGVFSSWVGTGL